VLSADAALSEPTTHRLLGALQRHGLVRRTCRGRYALGAAIAELATRYFAQMQLKQLAQDELLFLQRQFGLTTRLAILSGSDIVYVEQTKGYDSPMLRFGVGDRGIMFASAAGKAVLAFMDASERLRLFSRTRYAPLTQRTKTRPDDVRRDLAETRARGYAICDEEVVVGIRSIGAPVLDNSGRPLGAMTIVAAAESCSMRRLEAAAPRLIEAAIRVGQRHGAMIEP
jgi:DNA-binding IclR family transcriptional regulator